MIGLYIIWSVNLLMKVLSFGSHVIGLYAICYCKCKSNQSKILANIGIAELSIIIPKAIKIILQISTYERTQMLIRQMNDTKGEYDLFEEVLQLPREYFQLYDAFMFSFTTLLSLLMLMLTADRFLSTKYPFKYQIRFRKINMKRYVLCLYILAIVEGTLYFTLPGLKNVLLYILVGIALLFLVLSITTYGTIIQKVRSSREAFKNSAHIQLSRMKLKKMYMIPLLIISTYLLFYFIPWLVFSLYLVHRTRGYQTFLVGEAFEVVTGIVLLVDPLIYIWLTSKYRKVIVSLFCCSRTPSETKKCSTRSNTTFVMEARKCSVAAAACVLSVEKIRDG